MRRIAVTLVILIYATMSHAGQPPGLVLKVAEGAVSAVVGAHPGCEAADIPDTPARAVRVATGEVQLYSTESRTRVDRGPNLLTLHHDCRVVFQGGNQDDPSAYDDRAWIASPWSSDGTTIWAAVHNEFQGQRRPALCPSGRYMDCWYNSVTAAVSHDAGSSFQRLQPGVIASLPYRFDELGPGHHGYFNPSNVVSVSGAHFMMVFATKAELQAEGNCLLRTSDITRPEAWRGWNGSGFSVQFVNAYAGPTLASDHVCLPVGRNGLRWPVTSLVRHGATGLFVATMLNGAKDGGVYYATSPDLLNWSDPARLMAATGPGTWTCGNAPPTFYPSLLDPQSPDRNFETVGSTAQLFSVRFNVAGCKIGMDRELVRVPVSLVARV